MAAIAFTIEMTQPYSTARSSTYSASSLDLPRTRVANGYR